MVYNKYMYIYESVYANIETTLRCWSVKCRDICDTINNNLS